MRLLVCVLCALFSTASGACLRRTCDAPCTSETSVSDEGEQTFAATCGSPGRMTVPLRVSGCAVPVGEPGVGLAHAGVCGDIELTDNNEASILCMTPGRCVFATRMQTTTVTACHCPPPHHPNPCALDPCSSDERCGHSTCKPTNPENPEPCPITHTCSPCKACSDTPQCEANERPSEHPCTPESAEDMTCRLVEICCKKVFCTVETAVPDACHMGECGAQVCRRKDGCVGQNCAECVPCELCAPSSRKGVCEEGTTASALACTAEEVEMRVCTVSQHCCEKRYCRVPAPPALLFDPCDVGVCLSDLLCTPNPDRGCVHRRECKDYACHPCTTPCREAPTCQSPYSASNKPCSSDEAIAKKCHAKEACCQRVFCRIEARPAPLPSPAEGLPRECHYGLCKADEICTAAICPALARDCQNYVCSACARRCDAPPFCAMHELSSDLPCSYKEHKRGVCRIEERCCQRTFCRTADSVGHCVLGACPHSTICEDKWCDKDKLCDADELPYTCYEKPKKCCNEDPMCPASHALASTTPCTKDTARKGMCLHVQGCCDVLYCRRPLMTPLPEVREEICKEGTCPEDTVCVPTPSRCAFAPCAQHKCKPLCCEEPPECEVGSVQDACTVSEVSSGVCSEATRCCATLQCRRVGCAACGATDICSRSAADPTQFACHRSCCPAPPTSTPICESGYEESTSPCSATEYASGVCTMTEQCCVSHLCRRIPRDTNSPCDNVHCASPSVCAPNSCSEADTSCYPHLCVTPCCDTVPTCPEDTTPSGCTKEELSSGLCTVESVCCRDLHCRRRHGAPPPPSASRPLKGYDHCALQPCNPGEFCTPQRCEDTSCTPYACPMRAPCCSTVPACPASSTTHSTPCTKQELDDASCTRSVSCCMEVFCREGGGEDVASSSSGEGGGGGPVIWVLVLLVVVVVLVVVLVVVVVRRGRVSRTEKGSGHNVSATVANPVEAEFEKREEEGEAGVEFSVITSDMQGVVVEGVVLEENCCEVEQE